MRYVLIAMLFMVMVGLVSPGYTPTDSCSGVPFPIPCNPFLPPHTPGLPG